MDITKTIYLMITTNCNLDCPHCDIKTSEKDNWNKEAVLSRLSNKDHNVIFGGEPSLYIDRVISVADYCSSISTNLLYLPKKLLDLYNERLNVATSWNVNRFNHEQYEIWLNNVQRLKYKPLLLVTLTPDLLKDDTFVQRISNDFIGNFSALQFEQLHDPSKDQSFYDAVDKWLVSIYREIKKRSLIYLFPQFQKNATWKFDCSQTYTMYPDGSINYGCPEYTRTHILSRCYRCEFASVCQPCRLQSCCTGPNRLFEEIQNG